MNKPLFNVMLCSKSARLLIVTASLLSLDLQHAFADAPAKQGFDVFRILQTRNIFDPQRQPLSQPTPRPQTTNTSRRDSAALTGTMVTGGKKLAFFSGSRFDFNKVLPLNGKIAGGTLTRITSADVEIERDGKRVTIAIGQTLPLKDQSIVTDGSVASQAAPQLDSAGSSNSSSSAASTSTSSSPSTDSPSNSSPASDVLKRMLLRRQQETSK